jgi:hypothetical protein
MTIQEQIRGDMISAMKSKETEKLTLLRVIIGEFSRIGKDLSDTEASKIIRKMYDNAKELSNTYEMGVLDTYLPKMLNTEQTRKIVSDLIQTGGYSGMKDMGKVMGDIKNNPQFSQIDGKISSQIVKELLSV